MANTKVTIWKSVRVGDQWRYCRPVLAANSKIKPDWVRVNGHEEHHPEGYYVLHFLQGKKQVWEKTGLNPAMTVEAAERKEALLRALSVGIAVPEAESAPIVLREALKGYLEDYKLSKRPESYGLMKQTLEEWLDFSRKYVAHDIKRVDLLKYKAWLIERGRSERTGGNKMMRVNQFLRAIMGVEAGKGLVTVKDAKFVEQEPEIIDDDNLKKFFAACTTFQFAVFKCFLMSGLRKQELESLTWDDVDFTAGTLKVCAKPGFSPKTWEERSIEVPKELLRILKELPRKSQWVFANGNGNKYTHCWDNCVEIAEKAGVKGAHPHKFRATYATTLLQKGVDLKTVQKLLGHKNLESTMRYLAKAQSSVVKKKLDKIWR